MALAHICLQSPKSQRKNRLLNILAIIPARMGSSRFPGKPMARILGKPMIGHVFERVSKSTQLTTSAVATCDKEIFDYIESIGGTAVMTSDRHERASDRCAEALVKIEKMNKTKYDIVVLVQGDEPMTHPDMIDEAVAPMLRNSKIQVTNLLGKIDTIEKFDDRNCIKVVCDLVGNAIYFSRQSIPFQASLSGNIVGKQICIIPFQRNFLLEYARMAPTPLEIAESVDMLRILEHGHKVRMVPTNYQVQSVDTAEDLRLVEALLQKSPSGT